MNTLPDNWPEMTTDEQDAWAINRWLRERFPSNTFVVTMEPFNIRVDQDGADLKAIQDCVDDWFSHAYGTTVNWGTPAHVDA